MNLDTTTLKKIEEQLIYAKAKQDVLADLYEDMKKRHEKRDLIAELLDLKDDILLGEISLNGNRWWGFSHIDQEHIMIAINFAIEMISKTEAFKEGNKHNEEVNGNDNKH